MPASIWTKPDHQSRYCEHSSVKMSNSNFTEYAKDTKSSRWENEAKYQQYSTQYQNGSKTSEAWTSSDTDTIFHSTSLKKCTPSNNRTSVDNKLHFIAGGVAGCAATIVTCPIDVIKTRQQSSSGIATTQAKLSFPSSTPKGTNTRLMTVFARGSLRNTHHTGVVQPALSIQKSSILQHCRYILKVEGGKAFFKGLGIGLVGSVPSRALYFWTYNATKIGLVADFGLKANSMPTSIIAASAGGLVATTATCPLWVLKTKQQLHRRLNNSSLSCFECAKQVWRSEGWKGFYRGLTASYAGIVETVIYFTIYEHLKSWYMKRHNMDVSGAHSSMSSWWELPGLMVISSASKCVATSIVYPHEVARTRLREEPVQQRYSGFWQTLRDVAKTEGRIGLYGGLPAQLVRQVPNMAILMGVYETVVYLGQN
nr:solute carrier family 25 member 36 [Ciona intestinalis]|eukprot:XP_002130147.1 solute carrier family 25 member 36 [Ciona intestinalis]